jgi:hypothetical protein
MLWPELARESVVPVSVVPVDGKWLARYVPPHPVAGSRRRRREPEVAFVEPGIGARRKNAAGTTDARGTMRLAVVEATSKPHVAADRERQDAAEEKLGGKRAGPACRR